MTDRSVNLMGVDESQQVLTINWQENGITFYEAMSYAFAIGGHLDERAGVSVAILSFGCDTPLGRLHFVLPEYLEKAVSAMPMAEWLEARMGNEFVHEVSIDSEFSLEGIVTKVAAENGVITRVDLTLTLKRKTSVRI